VASRSDVRARMIDAGADLLAEQGYGVTMLDVIERADAPRGSIYYHFPDGKAELAIEVAEKVGREIEGYVAHVAAKVADPIVFLQRLIEHHKKRLVSSGYVLGCPLMGMVVTGVADSPDLEAAISASFNAWISSIAAALVGKGIRPAQAQQLAVLTVTGVEGSIVVARARHSTAPFTELSKAIAIMVAEAVAA
jgi:AcrR family transcriptional regulator